MEENTFSNDGELNETGKKAIAEKFREDELKQKFLKQITENENLQKYLAQFSQSSVRNFINHLVDLKMDAAKYGHYYEESRLNVQSRWMDEAFLHLEVIQQKKLFDLQCLWRAEKIKIDGLHLTCEFEFWENDILNCSFIEPVTAAELQLYLAFLETDDAIHPASCQYDSPYWQDYEAFKAGVEDDDSDHLDFPDWYHFHNTRNGTSGLLLLPDIRGEKECFYYDLEYNHRRKQEEMDGKVTAMDERPELNYDDYGFMKWYANNFEKGETKRRLLDTYSKRIKDAEKEAMEEAFELLFEAKETVPIEASANWKDGVKAAALRYRLNKIAEALPVAWEQYLMQLNTGIAFSGSFSKSFRDELKSMYALRIIEGRILNGEPGDLNF